MTFLSQFFKPSYKLQTTLFSTCKHFSRSFILTRFDIWNLILKIWDSSPQKKNLTWDPKYFFLAPTHVPFCVGRCFTLVNSHHVSNLNSIKILIFLCHSMGNANLDMVTWWMEFIHMDFHAWLCNPFIFHL